MMVKADPRCTMVVISRLMDTSEESQEVPSSMVVQQQEEEGA